MAPPDLARKYCTPVPGKASANTCNFCGHVMGGGGITRVKSHLAHLDSQKNVKMCDKVPHKVMEEMQALILGNVEKKKQKHTLEETIRRTVHKPYHTNADEEGPTPDYEADLPSSDEEVASGCSSGRVGSSVPIGSGGARLQNLNMSLRRYISLPVRGNLEWTRWWTQRRNRGSE